MATGDTRPSEDGPSYNFCSVSAFKQAKKHNNDTFAKIANNQRVKDMAKKGDAPREPEMLEVLIMVTAALASCAKGDKSVKDFYDILCHMPHEEIRFAGENFFLKKNEILLGRTPGVGVISIKGL